MNESIEIKKVHDNDKFIVTRKIVEEMNRNKVNEVNSELDKAIDNLKTQIKDIPKQVEAKIEHLKKELATLTDRKKAFEKYATKPVVKEDDKKTE